MNWHHSQDLWNVKTFLYFLSGQQYMTWGNTVCAMSSEVKGSHALCCNVWWGVHAKLGTKGKVDKHVGWIEGNRQCRQDLKVSPFFSPGAKGCIPTDWGHYVWCIYKHVLCTADYHTKRVQSRPCTAPGKGLNSDAYLGFLVSTVLMPCQANNLDDIFSRQPLGEGIELPKLWMRACSARMKEMKRAELDKKWTRVG